MIFIIRINFLSITTQFFIFISIFSIVSFSFSKKNRTIEFDYNLENDFINITLYIFIIENIVNVIFININD